MWSPGCCGVDYAPPTDRVHGLPDVCSRAGCSLGTIILAAETRGIGHIVPVCQISQTHLHTSITSYILVQSMIYDILCHISLPPLYSSPPKAPNHEHRTRRKKYRWAGRPPSR